jgi:hypothetical protein
MLYTNRSRTGKLAVCLPLAIVVGSPIASPAGGQAAGQTSTAVRSSERLLNDLVAEGIARSATFHRLVEAIAKTNTVVYIERGVCAFGHVRACLLPFMAATRNVRYLRVVLTEPLNLRDRNRLIARVGHELQHALEVAERPDVVDVTDMAALFRHSGVPLGRRLGYEPSAARAAGDAVLDELQVNRKTQRDERNH